MKPSIIDISEVIGLRDIQRDCQINSQCLTQLILRLERVLSAASERQDTQDLDRLYTIRDRELANCRELNDLIIGLERKPRAEKA